MLGDIRWGATGPGTLKPSLNTRDALVFLLFVAIGTSAVLSYHDITWLMAEGQRADHAAWQAGAFHGIVRNFIFSSVLNLGLLIAIALLIRRYTRRRRQPAPENELASIVNSSHDAIIGKTPEGIVTSWNRGAEQMYGYSAHEMVGKPIGILAVPECAHDIPRILEEIRKGETITEYESLRIAKSGEVLNVSLTVSPIRDAEGKTIGASAIGRDITAQRRAEESLHRSEEQYRLLFESNPLPAWVYDRDSLRFLAVNEAAVQHYGYSRREFLAMTIQDIRPERDRLAVLKAMSSLSDQIAASGGRRHRKKDGSLIDVEITSNTINLFGRDAALVLVQDVTEQKQNEDRLRHSENKFATAFQLSPLAITISTCKEGRYVDVNDAFLKVVGYERNEVLGRRVDELGIWVDLNDRAAMVEQLTQSYKVRALETKFRSKMGEERSVQLSADLIELDGEPCVLAITQDVTEAQQLEQQFRQAQRMEAVGRLAGGVAHDFNNILGVIIGYSELLQERLPPGDLSRTRVDEIKKAADRAGSLTQQLLVFSRQQIVQPKVLDLNAIVNSLGSMLQRMIGEDVELVLDLGDELGCFQADLGQMEQILMNLAVNARDAIPAGGKIVIKTDNVELDETYARQQPGVLPGSYVMLSVSDTGTGISAEVQPHIFEPFFTTKEPGKGTGLGLSTVYGVVRQSSGHIGVYSELGRGTTFKIYLPRLLAKPSPLHRETPVMTIVGGSETILLVEDDEPLRQLTGGILKDSGYVVLEARDPETALKIEEEHIGGIDLLLTDVVMPKISGCELAARLQRKHPGLKLLYMSGYADDIIVHQGVLDPDISLLQKPFTKNYLLGKVRTLLGERKQKGRGTAAPR